MSITPEKLTYFPFIGWFISLTVNRNSGDDRIMGHIMQSVTAAAFFSALLILLGAVLTVCSRGGGYFRFFLVLLIYAVYFFYFLVSVLGTRSLLKGKDTFCPVLQRVSKKLNF